MRHARSAALCITMLMAASSAFAETPSIRLTAPAWMLSADNPLRRDRPATAAIEVELPGYLHNPPLFVPDRPRTAPQAPDVVEIDQILAALRPDLGIAAPMQVHAEAYYRDYVLALAFVQAEPPDWRVFALVNPAGEGWRHDPKALSDAMIETVAAGWHENGWIEVIPGDVVTARN